MSDPEDNKKDPPERKTDSSSDDKTRTYHKDSGSSGLSAHHPRQIGQYIIKRVIASGGMGTVFEAIQENPRRPVAVKVVKGSLVSEEAVRRFEYEAQTLARLRHPGIAQIYEAGSYDDGGTLTPFFAMEYIPNARSVIEYAARKGLGTRDRLEIFLQVCQAIHHGHQRGIVHRDLKPDNIMVDSNGRVRIIDFGVARTTDADMRQVAIQTEAGQLIGSIQYMSPEQFETDSHDIDTRSDVYTLGLVLYELLSGAMPYSTSSDKIFDFASEVRTGNKIPLGAQNRALSGELEAIVHKAMQRDREHRYQSAYGLEQDIRRFLAGDAVVARPPGLSYQFRVFARRNKVVIGLVAGVFVALLAGVATTTSLLVQVDQERQKAEIASQKARAGQEFLSSVLTSAFPYGFGDGTTVLDIIDRSSQKLTGAFPDDPEVEAELRKCLGKAYMNLGHWDPAKRELGTALRLCEDNLGPTHDKTLESRYDMAAILSILNDRKGQLSNNRALLAAYIERWGESSPDVLKRKGILAGGLMSSGSYSSARKYSEESWEGLKLQLGADSSSTLYEQIRYAWILLETGRTVEAEELVRDALSRAERVYGQDHDLVRMAKSGLAAAYIVQSKIDSAIAVYGSRKMPEKFGIERTFQGELDLSSRPFQLLVFFETWCPYSNNAMVRFEKVYQQYGLFGLNVIGLTSTTKNSTEEDVERFIAEKKISFAAFKENGRAWNYFDCTGTPSVRLLCNGYQIWEWISPAFSWVPTVILEGLVEAQNRGIVKASVAR